MTMKKLIKVAEEFDSLPESAKARPEIQTFYVGLMQAELGVSRNTQTSRESVLDYVSTYPGQSIKEISRGMGITETSARDHVRKLRKCKKITVEITGPQGNPHLHFASA